MQNDVPIAAVSQSIEELMSLSATLQKLGVKDIVLDAGTYFGPGNLTFTFDNIQQLRIAGIDRADHGSTSCLLVSSQG